MKIRKKAEQKNFIVNDWFYTKFELNNLYEKGIITQIDDETKEDGQPVYRIYSRNCERVEVIIDSGYYTTVVILSDGSYVYVEI